jgi:heptosyltransferase-2
MKEMRKILVIRFSSIGDIVLTTPVVRCLKKQFPDAEIHFLTKKKFAQVVANNPYISKVHLFSDNLSETIKELRAERFDFVVDLHRNLRSKRVKMALRRPSGTFPKLNIRKWWYVRTKCKSVMPDVHIVDRYFEAVAKLGVKNDKQGLDYFAAPEPDFRLPFDKYIAVVCGGTYVTKQIPPRLIWELTQCKEYNFVLLGDVGDRQRLESIGQPWGDNVFNACGQTTLNQSALLVKNAEAVVTSDTGLMHISAAYGKKTVAVWGNTTPQLGMYPYMPQCEGNFVNLERELPCRPCSKLGYDKCPKGHLRCMMDISAEEIMAEAGRIINN